MNSEIGDTEDCCILFDLASSFIHCGIGKGVALSRVSSVGGVMYSGMGDREHCSILFDLVSSFIHCGIGDGVALSSMSSVGGVM